MEGTFKQATERLKKTKFSESTSQNDWKNMLWPHLIFRMKCLPRWEDDSYICTRLYEETKK